jgi:hypothetical protein
MFFHHKPKFKRVTSEIVIKAKKDGSLSVKEVITFDNSVATMTIINKGNIEMRDFADNSVPINKKR